jgi:hypothetical protein
MSPTHPLRPPHRAGHQRLPSSITPYLAVGCGGPEEADGRMESWKYDPWVLAENGVADPCSLYLSLRESGDERIQKEIQLLIERLPQ